MKKFVEDVYFHREKEENDELIDKADSMGFKKASELAYFGYEIGMEVEISEDCRVKLLKIEGIDVSDKDIYI